MTSYVLYLTTTRNSPNFYVMNEEKNVMKESWAFFEANGARGE